MVGVVAQQVVGKAALDDAALGGAEVQNHLGHRLEQLVGKRARVHTVGQKRHVVHGKALVVGGHLVHRLALAQGRTYQQLVIVQGNAQLAGEHLADLVSLGAKVARDGNHHRLAGALGLAKRQALLDLVLDYRHAMPPKELTKIRLTNYKATPGRTGT